MFRKWMCFVLCAAMLLTAASLYANAQDNIDFYKIRIDAGQGVYIEKAILEEDELYIPADNFSRYTRYHYDSEIGVFLVKGQELGKAFKYVQVLPEEKEVRIGRKKVKLQNCYEVDGQLYLPFCQMLPILNAEIVTAESGLGRVIVVANSDCSMAELLYDFSLNDYAYDLSKEFYDSEWLLLGYTMPSYLFDSVKDFRFDRLDVVWDSGTYSDYKEIFTDYLKDNSLYNRAYSEYDDMKTIISVITGIQGETKKLYDILDWVEKMEKEEIPLPPDVITWVFRDSGMDFIDESVYYFEDDLESWLKAVHGDDPAVNFADFMKGMDVLYTYINHVEDNHKMLDAVYDITSDGSSWDAQYRAAKTVYQLYDGNFLRAVRDHFTEEKLNEYLKESAGGKQFLMYSLTAKVGGELMEAVMPGDTSEVSRLTLHAGVVNEAKEKAGSGVMDTEASAEDFRQSLLLMLFASRKCYQIMAETAEAYDHNAADYRAKIEKIENMIMGLYLVSENLRFDTYEHFEEYCLRNRELLKQAGIFTEPEQLQPGDLDEIEKFVEEGVYLEYLRGHPEYKYYALLDVNQDGVRELLASETQSSPHHYVDLYYYQNGQFNRASLSYYSNGMLLTFDYLWAKSADFRYDRVNRWIVAEGSASSGGGYSFYYLDEDMNLHETGLGWVDMVEYYYLDGMMYDNVPESDEIIQDAYSELRQKWSEGEEEPIVFLPLP